MESAQKTPVRSKEGYGPPFAVDLFPVDSTDLHAKSMSILISDLSFIKDIFHKLWQIYVERTFQAGLYLTLYLEKLL